MILSRVLKGHWTVSILVSILIMGSFGISQQAFAFPVSVTSSDDPNCDPLSAVPPDVDELGVFFPPDELISAFHSGPNFAPACPSSAFASDFVEITNLTPDFWTEVWYVADADTFITNFDGFVDGGFGPLQAFKIDSVGANTPLASESLAGDGVFEPGETWTFIIDDYFNTFGLPPDAIDSIGVGPDSFTGTSGSIIAIHADEGQPIGGTSIPIDTTALLVAGAQTISPWLILGGLSVIGIGFVIFTLKRRR